MTMRTLAITGLGLVLAAGCAGAPVTAEGSEQFEFTDESAWRWRDGQLELHGASSYEIARWAGVSWGQIAGLHIGLAAFGLGSLTQTAWLWVRSRPVMQRLDERDASRPSLHSPVADTLSVSENP